MSDLIDFLSREVPWLLPMLAWVGGIILVILILAIPAYFVFWPFFQRARAQLASFIDRLVEKFKTIRTERANRLDSAADEFLTDGGLRRLKTEAAGHWTALTIGLSRTLRRLHKPLRKASNSLHDLTKRVSTLEKQVQKSEVAKLQDLTVLPDPQELSESVAKIKVAWIKLISTAIVLPALMVVNTGMLSEILLDLGVVPATLTFLGLQLAYVFAFILTLVEAGLGVAHAATRSDNPEKVTVFPIVITIFAVIVACVEGFFYSRVAPTGTFTLPFFNYEMPQSDLFFFWGFVLVMTLFSLGLIAFDAAVTIVRGTPSRTLRREFKKLRKDHEQYAQALKQSEEALVVARASANGTDQVIQGPATNAESVHEELVRISDRVENLQKTVPEWAKDTEEPLTRSEVHDLAQRAGLWLLLTAAGLCVITITGLYTLESFYPSLLPLLLWVLAVGQAVAFFAVGLLLGAGETIVQGTHGERKVWAAPQFSRLLAYILGCAILIAHLVIFFAIALPISLGGLWFLNLLVGLFLIAAGYQLIPLLNVMRLWLRRLWNVVVIAFQMIWLVLVRIVQFVVIVLENLSYLLALPLLKLFHRRREVAEAENLRLSSIPSRPPSLEGQSGGDAS
ncbi:MAG: hypothetical protein HY562_03125 [Ignavibacteriales bacterium]|nr:hypothetical protein [Ignavibacteriales bacterium]